MKNLLIETLRFVGMIITVAGIVAIAIMATPVRAEETGTQDIAKLWAAVQVVSQFCPATNVDLDKLDPYTNLYNMASALDEQATRGAYLIETVEMAKAVNVDGIEGVCASIESRYAAIKLFVHVED